MTRRRTLHAALAALLLLAPACGGDEGGGDVAEDGVADGSDTLDLTGRSVYHITMTPKDMDPITLDRELTDNPGKYFAFGSTHIAPAVSLAVSDNVISPRTIYLTLNFGIVIPSFDYSIDVDGPGEYPFVPAEVSNPPEIELTISGLEYRSHVAGSDGSISIEQWSTTPGEVVSGTFSGRVLQDTINEDKRWVDVDGWFHFVLPEQNNGQPR
ncbi:MAG: hypothetical protein EP329_17990 [Deltaproteobacteria bacterium]|nr:MAG: hypothetical protein EP329_17990 [Deltaproteobacteria bacterium]